MSVQIDVPIAADSPEREIPFMADELTIATFTPSAKKVLSRIYSGMLDESATLADGAVVNSTDRVFQKLVELVAANE